MMTYFMSSSSDSPAKLLVSEVFMNITTLLKSSFRLKELSRGKKYTPEQRIVKLREKY